MLYTPPANPAADHPSTTPHQDQGNLKDKYIEVKGIQISTTVLPKTFSCLSIGLWWLAKELFQWIFCSLKKCDVCFGKVKDLQWCVLTCNETGEFGTWALWDSQVTWSLSKLGFTLKFQFQRLQCLLCLYNTHEKSKTNTYHCKNIHHKMKPSLDGRAKYCHICFLTIYRAQACRTIWFGQ